MEESKEANTTTGRATHRLSHGLHDKVCTTWIAIIFLIIDLFGTGGKLYVWTNSEGS